MIEFPPPDPGLVHLARKNLIFEVGESEAGERLDKFLAQAADLTRGRVRALIDFGSVWVRGRACRQQSRLLKAGDWVTFQAPEYGPVKFYEADPERILFQDEWLLAYDKEAGIPCQQTPYDGYNHLFGALSRLRPGYLGLHHRLDSLTSGVMLFSLSQKINPSLSRVFAQGRLTKIYLAVVQGSPPQDSWEVDRPVAKRQGGYFCPEDGRGKAALTSFTVLKRGKGRALIKARPLTGRTHQIRLHLALSGHPVVGDAEYKGRPAPRLMLHALSLSFNHPVTGQTLTIEAPRPEDFRPSDM
ncbi:MAG: RluA family pseudouridine synthase [Pseudomonadota bacterium]